MSLSHAKDGSLFRRRVEGLRPVEGKDRIRMGDRPPSFLMNLPIWPSPTVLDCPPVFFPLSMLTFLSYFRLMSFTFSLEASFSSFPLFPWFFFPPPPSPKPPLEPCCFFSHPGRLDPLSLPITLPTKIFVPTFDERSTAERPPLPSPEHPLIVMSFCFGRFFCSFHPL